MLDIKNVSVSFGNKDVLQNVSLSIGTYEKIGLIGVNGAGKSTLLKTVAGILEPDLGKVSFDGSMSYLSQEIHKEVGKVGDTNIYNSKGSLSIAEYLILEKGLDIEEWEINKFLQHLNMKDKDSSSIVQELSGGQKIKVELIRILTEQSDLLILDEPTNFLDIPSVEWLMKFLISYPKALLVVSHDLRLMNKGINRIWYLNERTHGVEVYKGNYEQFLKLKSEKEEWLVKQIRNDERKAKHLYESAEHLAGRKTKKEKQKSAKRFEEVKAIKESIKERSVALAKSKKMKISMPPVSPSSRYVLSVENLSKSYIKDFPILKDVSFEVERGEKFAVIGKNGAGKTTLLKILAGRLKEDSGSIKWGHNVTIGYYSQEYEDLDYEKTVMENIAYLEMSDLEKRRFLGSFLISGDMVNQKVRSLSGGEKTRFALAKLFAQRYNVLVLDEPTTYLDPQSQNILLEALSGYKGTMILVSHEPKFVKELGIDKVLLMPEEKYTHFLAEFVERVGIT